MRHELTRADILDHANTIREDYNRQDMKLTLRQMYYRFVAQGISPSGQLHYKRIGDVLTDARYDGSFPIEGLEDRGREVHPGSFTRLDNDGIEAALRQSASWLRDFPEITLKHDRWAGQPHHVSVWVEKQALEGVFQPTCDELGVSWFACKGYPSVSALWEWIQQVQRSMNHRSRLLGCERHEGAAEDCTVLYFGDHDPDGWEIPRSALRNLKKLMAVKGIRIPLVFNRIALNMDQIEQYEPPPFEAKMSSARYAGYVKEHATDEAWELDALEPVTLRDLIRENVEEYFDQDIYDANEVRIEELRDEMRDAIREPTWAANALEG